MYVIYFFLFFFFFFTDTATTEIYTLSLHDALPIWQRSRPYLFSNSVAPPIVAASLRVLDLLTESDELRARLGENTKFLDRKSTRLNSSHMSISYAVFCLKKKKQITILYTRKIHTIN